MSFFLGFVSGVVSLTVAIAILAAFVWVYVKSLFRGSR